MHSLQAQSDLLLGVNYVGVFFCLAVRAVFLF